MGSHQITSYATDKYFKAIKQHWDVICHAYFVTALERMLADEVAGDPMTDQKWIRSSLSRLSNSAKRKGIR